MLKRSTKILTNPGTENHPSRKSIAFSIAAAFVLMLTLATPSSAQTFRGTILGTVTDPNGAVVPGATVTAKNVGTGIERSTVSDEFGNYTLTELQTGTYQVIVRKTGFETLTINEVAVEVASERRVDPALAVAGTTDQVIVAASNQVETTNTTLGGTISTREVADLPINGRDFTKFLVMVPGATGDPSGATDSPGSFGLFSANGNRGRANNFLLDGTDMNDGYRNLPAINEAGVFGTPATILLIDAISEAAILSNFEAEYGRNSGAIINIVTKSGTNDCTDHCLNSSAITSSTRGIFSIPNQTRKLRFETINSGARLAALSFAIVRSSSSLSRAKRSGSA